MARKHRKTKKKTQTTSWSVYALPFVFFLVQVSVLPGAFSPFRLGKHFIAMAGLALILSLGFAGEIRKHRFSFPRCWATSILFTLPVLQLGSIFWSASPHRSVASALATLTWILAIIWIATREPEARVRALNWALAGAALSAIVLVAQAAGIRFEFLNGPGSSERLLLTGLAGNPSDFAMASCLFLPLLLPTLEFRSKQRLRWVLTGLLVLAILLSQSLTAIAAALLTLLAWSLWHEDRRITISGIVTIVLIAVLLLAALPSERIQKQLHRLHTGKWYALLSARADGWTAAVQMIKENPIHGVGADHFSHWFYPYRLQWLEKHDEIGGRGELATHFDWVHCDPLQLIAELGALGGLWMMALVGSFVPFLSRRDPTLILGVLAFGPFALFHYPTHLAITLVPISLILAHQLAQRPRIRFPDLPLLPRAALMIVLVGSGLAYASFEFRNVLLDAWRGTIESTLVAAQNAPPEIRARMAASIERQSATRLAHNQSAGGWILRIVGKARLLRDNAIGAESAFRTSHQLWPHEESEFGLGLALAAQGRRSEAIMHLDRVCRTNPALAKLIPDPDLRRSLRVVQKRRRVRNR